MEQVIALVRIENAFWSVIPLLFIIHEWNFTGYVSHQRLTVT